MYDSLKNHFRQALPFTEEELSAVDHFFKERIFAKKAMLLESPQPCKYLFFIVRPVIFRLKINGRPPL